MESELWDVGVRGGWDLRSTCQGPPSAASRDRRHRGRRLSHGCLQPHWCFKTLWRRFIGCRRHRPIDLRSLVGMTLLLVACLGCCGVSQPESPALNREGLPW